ncbi:glycoside hydrolase family 78 protein [Paenibacillus sp. CC-CFT747]|nr:glycoside hydrolase family 78 protein [Paenibacillus sp. CC-CFT747]
MINWVADWIWRSRRIRVNDFAYFRKEFNVGEKLLAARLYVSAHHYVQVYLNGLRIGGFGTPAPTNPWKRKLYTVHEISGYLREGVNCITADAHFLGGGGQNYVDGLPGFRLELHLTYKNGKKKVVKTDTTWDTLVDPPHRTGTPYHQNRRVSAIEDYDAGKWQPGWRNGGYSYTLKTTKAKKARIGREEWPMVRQCVPEGAIKEELSLVKLDLPESTRCDEEMPQVFDAGRIVSGWPKFKLKGISGTTVRIRYSEDLDISGRVKHNVCNEESDNYYDQYTMRGSPLEEWQPNFSYKAFRYLEVCGYPLPIEPDTELTVCAAYTGIDYFGSFRCSDEHLNALYDACIRTQKNNMLGQIVDCPHREQAQYLADADLQAEALIYNFDAIALLEKTLSDFADVQLDDGSFPFVAPSNSDNPHFRLQIPEWDLHYATLLWKLYEASGDVSKLAAFYGPLCRMVDYFLFKLDQATGLVPIGKGWHISDWPYPSVEHKGEFLTVEQIKLLQAIRLTSKTASVIGEVKDHAYYYEAAERLKGSILTYLYDRQSAQFKDSSDSIRTHQGVTALALYADAVPDDDREKAIRAVADKPWECRTVLSLPLLRMLFDNGRETEAFAILNRREYPGWGYMITQGAMTMWEGWEDIESHSHAWNGYPARLLQEYIVGIRSTAPGFKSMVIRPYIPASLTFAEAKVWTVQGNLFVRWERMNEDAIHLVLSIPQEIEGRLEVRLPQRTVVLTIGPGEHTIRL